MTALSDFTCRSATPERWGDLVRLFGPRGACAGCWCQWFRLPKRRFEAGKSHGGEGNRRALEEQVRGGDEPGLLAYAGGEPVGWAALAPRADYPRLARARSLAVENLPDPGGPVWSVPCFFVRRDHRRRGVTVALLEAAAAHAARRGAAALEGYPVLPKPAGLPDAFAYHGTAAAFRRAGLTEIARPSPTRAIYRRPLFS